MNDKKHLIYNEHSINYGKEVMELDLLYDEYLQKYKNQILLDKLHYRIFYEFDNSLIEDFEKYINIIGKHIKTQINNVDYLRYLEKIIEKVSEINKQVRSKVDGYTFNSSIVDILTEDLRTENDETIKLYLKVTIAKIEEVLKAQEDRRKYDTQLRLYNFVDRKILLFDKASTLDDYIYCLICYKKIINYYDFRNNYVILEYINKRINQLQNKINAYPENSYFIKQRIYDEEECINLVDALLFVKRDINNERIEYIRPALEKDSYLVAIGSKVRILFLDDNEFEDFKIVEDYDREHRHISVKPFEEFHILNPGELSALSPIAKAIIGKGKGDIVNINAPNGRFNIKIIDIIWIGK